ncbi:MAG: DNA-binding NtrC family response regulator [bacterium]|jgi:DNA-binding NtrC family response regulator
MPKYESKLLIIDDDDNMRFLLESEFKDLGYNVTAADSAFTGLPLLQKGDFDLVILDIKMPGMDGIEALGRIVGTKRGLPVIIHSAYSHYKENYLTWSASAYVVKSSDLTELKNTAVKLIEEKEATQ